MGGWPSAIHRVCGERARTYPCHSSGNGFGASHNHTSGYCTGTRGDACRNAGNRDGAHRAGYFACYAGGKGRSR